jgi:alpha-ribazole phosphatase
MNVVLIRHTRVEIPPGLCYGHHDVALASTFAADAAAVSAALPWRPLEVRTSPATRCTRLAASLGVIDVRVDPRLAELHMGRWEGRRWDELSGPEVEAWFADPWQARPPEGETAPELIARVTALRDELQSSNADRVALVTHAGVIRAWRSLAESRPLAELFAEAVPFGCIVTAA